MKTAKKKKKKKKIKPIYLPNGDILNANELMIKYDFDNDPVFKAKFEKAKKDLREHPEWFSQLKKF